MRENIGLGGLAWYELSTGRLSQQMGHSSFSTKLDVSKKLELVDKEAIALWSLLTRYRDIEMVWMATKIITKNH